MAKIQWKPGTMLYPVPAVMISVRHGDVDNIITVAWAGTICTDPPMVSISIRPERYSYDLLKQSGEFVINIPGKDLAHATDFCGVRSGRDMDKFATLNLHKEVASKVNVPMIAEAPLAIECKVTEVLELGSHHMFIAKVLAVNVEESLLDASNKLHLERADLLAYVHGNYCVMSETVGTFGFSVKRPEKRIEKQPGKQAEKQPEKRSGKKMRDGAEFAQTQTAPSTQRRKREVGKPQVSRFKSNKPASNSPHHKKDKGSSSTPFRDKSTKD